MDRIHRPSISPFLKRSELEKRPNSGMTLENSPSSPNCLLISFRYSFASWKAVLIESSKYRSHTASSKAVRLCTLQLQFFRVIRYVPRCFRHSAWNAAWTYAAPFSRLPPWGTRDNDFGKPLHGDGHLGFQATLTEEAELTSGGVEGDGLTAVDASAVSGADTHAGPPF